MPAAPTADAPPVFKAAADPPVEEEEEADAPATQMLLDDADYSAPPTTPDFAEDEMMLEEAAPALDVESVLVEVEEKKKEEKPAPAPEELAQTLMNLADAADPPKAAEPAPEPDVDALYEQWKMESAYGNVPEPKHVTWADPLAIEENGKPVRQKKKAAQKKRPSKADRDVMGVQPLGGRKRRLAESATTSTEEPPSKRARYEDVGDAPLSDAHVDELGVALVNA